ncbi:hypothetical protein ACFW04_011918 [Cataglyphis niger]
MENLDKGLIQADLNILNEIVTSTQEKSDRYKHQQTDTFLSDDDIISRYHKTFETLIKRSTDTSRYICVSYQRLYYKRNVKTIRFNGTYTKKLTRNIHVIIVQKNFIKFYTHTAYCILNNLFTYDVSEVISSLNTFENILIQRAFIINKRLPQRQMIQKVKGRTFHLLLPLQETLNKLCSTTDSINDNHELYILIRGIPTKSKIIGEEIVNIKKIFDILTSEFQMEQSEDNTEATLDEPKFLNNPMKEIKNEMMIEVALGQQKAMLIQVTDENDGYYEQYTIYPLYEKKTNKTASTLYQMLKIQEMPLKNRQQYYRLNQQYLFYLLNDANIRQLSRGIYHKMNVNNPRVPYTAAKYLEAMSKELLESNLNTIFATLRNTEQYWRKPRSLNYITVLVTRDLLSSYRFLDNKFRAMLDFISSKDHPIGEVTHYLWRREYRVESNIEEVFKFILQRISCKMPDQNILPLFYRLINTHQRYTHNDYCLRSKKEGRKVIRRCRFGFPRPVTNTLNMRDEATSIAVIWIYNLLMKNHLLKIGCLLGKHRWYITKYMNKAGKSELSDTILDSKNNKNKSLASYLWNIALRFTNNREYVNQIRYRKLKNRKEIEALDADSIDIFYPSLIDNHYPHRSNELANMSFYEFAQWYDISKIKPKNEDIEYYKIDNGYYLKRRQCRCFINHYRYNINTQKIINECDTYIYESFHKIKLHLIEALQYYEKLEELQKAFETAKDNLDDPENRCSIGVQNIEAGEAMQDFKILRSCTKSLCKFPTKLMILKNYAK